MGKTMLESMSQFVKKFSHEKKIIWAVSLCKSKLPDSFDI